MSKAKEATAEAVEVFDVNATQEVVLEKDTDEGIHQLTFQVDGIDDKALAEFDRLQHVKIDSEGQDAQSFSVDDLQACKEFFDSQVTLSDGFEGDVPENWQTFFSADEKQAVVGTLLGHYTVDDERDEEKIVKKFSFVAKPKRKEIRLKCFFNGEEIETSFVMPFKSDRDLKTYRKATSKMVMKKGMSGTFLPETWVALGRLFDSMEIEVTGYAGGVVPLHHKQTVLREFFDRTAQATAKKPRS